MSFEPDCYISVSHGRREAREAATSTSGSADAGRVVALNSKGFIDASMLDPDINYQSGDEVIAQDEPPADNFEGRIWRETDTDKMYAFVNGEWQEFILEPQISSDSGTTDVDVNGGFF